MSKPLSTHPKAKKSLGQHFLRDAGAARRIVELAHIQPVDQVMEIGPGPGALTNLIRAASWQRLLLVEKDDFYAQNHAAQAGSLEEIWHGDAMQFPWPSLEGHWIIMGNLPYNIASPLMWDIVSQVPALTRAVFMIQKEVGDRILAAPGTKTYGGLSVWINSFTHSARGFNLGPGAFSPPPKVDSTVIVLTPRPKAELPANPVALAALIKTCFGRRRKQLHGILRETYPNYNASLLSRLDIEGQVRPESLTPNDFQRLSLALLETHPS